MDISETLDGRVKNPFKETMTLMVKIVETDKQ